MSWNKNTINLSQIDAWINLCKSNNMAYELTVLGKVRGRGLNDDGDLEIRRLRCGESVLLERMERTADCDSDDLIQSYQYNRATEPKQWDIEIGDEEDNG
jgi:hypothetical protein